MTGTAAREIPERRTEYRHDRPPRALHHAAAAGFFYLYLRSRASRTRTSRRGFSRTLLTPSSELGPFAFYYADGPGCPVLGRNRA